jgi:hypothetical protein
VQRLAAAGTAVLAAIWLVVFSVKLSSGWFGRVTASMEIDRTTHANAVSFAVIGIAAQLAMLCALLFLAIHMWRGSRLAVYIAYALTFIILFLTGKEAIRQGTNVGQWLGVGLDCVVLALILLGLRASRLAEFSEGADTAP